MKTDEFVAEVQRRADIGSQESALDAISATLATLSERLVGGEVKDLASQLPYEIGVYLAQPMAGAGEPFGLDEFFWRISQRAGIDLQEASLRARVVIGVLCEAVTMGEIENVRAQLPGDIRQLFMVENEGDLPPVDVEDMPETAEFQ
ncbi:MAG TPA: DUF2267 domain-containing protein [Ktedonobacteraceae bacterium]